MRQMPLDAPVVRAVAAPNTLLRYALAIGVVLLVLAVRAALGGVLDPSRFILFFSAVALAAWYGGIGPGLLATAGSVATRMAAVGRWNPDAVLTHEAAAAVSFWPGLAVPVVRCTVCHHRAPQSGLSSPVV